MTTKEMQFLFETLLRDSWKGFEVKEKPDTDDIFRYLNYAQDKYLREKYLSQPLMRDNIALIRAKSDDLRKLIDIESGLSLAGVSGVENRYLVNLPDDYLYYIKSLSKITKTALPEITTATWTTNREADYSKIENITTTPYNSPILRKPVVLFKGDDSLLLFTDSYTSVSDFELTYLRKPKSLVLTISNASTETTECELDYYIHEQIVSLALELYLSTKFRLTSKEEENSGR